LQAVETGKKGLAPTVELQPRTRPYLIMALHI